MGALIVIPFMLAWYLPLAIPHRKNIREKPRYYITALFMGLVSFFVSVILQTLFGIATKDIQVPSGTVWAELYSFVRIFIIVAITEECVKYFFGRLAVKRVSDFTEAGSMLIFAMTGFGFEFVESAFSGSAAGIMRGLTALHMFFQLWMGKYRWQALRARELGDTEAYKKLMRKTFLVPIVMHAIFDYPVLRVSSLAETLAESGTTGLTSDGVIVLACAGFALLFALGCGIYIFIDARRTVREETLAFEAERANDTESSSVSAEK